MARGPAARGITKRTLSSSASISASRILRSSGSSKDKALQKMVQEANISNTSGSTATDSPPVDFQMSNDGHYPGDMDKKKIFPLMQLPAEIRNEIYRACLTRPFNILLARKEPPPPPPEPEPTKEDDEAPARDASSDTEDSDLDFEIGGSATSASTATPGPSSSSAQATAGSSNSKASGRRQWNRRSAARASTRFVGSLGLSGRSSPSTAPSTTANTASAVFRPVTSRPNRVRTAVKKQPAPRKPRPQDVDPLIVTILRLSKQIYQEARAVLYNENIFTLDLDTALPTLGLLHQRSRRQIKHVELEIPCYNEIQEKFQETVRLGLRYCFGLKKLVIYMPFIVPGADGSGTTGNTPLYANGFDILRWLPKECEVVLQGNVCAEVKAVVSKHATLAKTLDDVRNSAFLSAEI
jgi:hypothetical protein